MKGIAITTGNKMSVVNYEEPLSQTIKNVFYSKIEEETENDG